MEKIKETFLKRYGVKEWLGVVLGLVIISIQIYKYATNSFNHDFTVEIGVFSIGAMLLFAPLTILNIIRKARGLKTK